MKLTVLVDNNTLIDRYLLGEPGLAFLLQEGDRRVLFDCGYSRVLCHNAERLGIDLCDLDTVVLSHGHLDHTWGLAHLTSLYTERATENRPTPHPVLVAHPEALAPKCTAAGLPTGTLLSREVLAEYMTVRLSAAPVPLTDRLLFLGEIPRVTDFETVPTEDRRRQTPAGLVPDTLPDDTALAYRGADGLVIITGCAHAGIANTVIQARKLTGETRVAAIIGGLHLLDPAPARLAATVDFLRQAGVAALYPCHCTSLAAKIALGQAAPVHDVGVGLVLQLD